LLGWTGIGWLTALFYATQTDTLKEIQDIKRKQQSEKEKNNS